MRGASGVVVVALIAACGVEVDVDGKACPCSGGYVCDQVKNVCVRPGAQTVVTTPAACDPCPFTTNADCTDTTRPACVAGSDGTKVCVECDPKNDTCRDGTYCNDKSQCTPGCRTSELCEKLSPSSPICSPTRHACVGCLSSDTCGGRTCSENGTCAESCDATKPCPGGLACCAGLCVDEATDVFNCGVCGKTCSGTNGSAKCEAGACTAACADGFAHCGTDPTSGCDTATRTDPNNCGGCGKVCKDSVQHATSVSCVASKCLATACEKGFLDKDGNPENGCETPCGARDQVCCASNTCNSELNCRSGKCTTSGGGGGD